MRSNPIRRVARGVLVISMLGALGYVVLPRSTSPQAHAATVPPAEQAAAGEEGVSPCPTICSDANKHGCENDSRGDACLDICERARRTADGRCTGAVDALVWCVARLPPSSVECGANGQTQPSSGACEQETRAMLACVRGSAAG